MRVLGICHDVLICSAALVVDGRIVSAIPEERLDRRKQSREFPTLAVRACLEAGGVDLSQVDEIAIGWNPSIEMETTPGGFLTRRWRTEHLAQVPARFMRMLGKASAQITVSGAALQCPPITFVNHYDAHIGNALYLSPFDRAAILIMDGRAEKQTSLLAVAQGTRIEKVAEVSFPHSLGLFYGAVTQFLGFTPDSDEWKVMALASYADAQNEYLEPLRRLIRVHDDGTFELALDHFEFYNFWDARMYSDKFVRTFGEPRARGSKLLTRHEKLAAAMQRVFEETMTRIMVILHQRSGEKNVVVSGGCFMNSVFNGKIHDVTPFTDSFISSSPDDSGTSIGAALYLSALRTGRRSPEPCLDNYWGPEWTDEQCLDIVRRFKIAHEVVANPSARAAQDLVDGEIIGWFQGRMEFGQRALGNRSILLDPRRKDGKDIVNAAIKFREAFRPFAPAILAEHTAEWFICPKGARVPFMERVFPFLPEKRELVPAVVHADGSGRLQTVDEHSAPRYRALIEAFHARTQVPIVLNTSFNLNGEPIVCSPEDALRTFYTCALDTLYLGNVRITK